MKGKGSVWTALIFCLQRPYQKLNLLEQYKLNTLVHKWRGCRWAMSFADHTKIVSIKPPDMVISADNSMWMQELQMQKRRIIGAINKYYRQRSSPIFLYYETSELCESREQYIYISS